MQKLIAFLHKFTIPFNILAIIFWSYLIYSRYNTTTDGSYFFYIVPAIFIVLSSFNLVMAVKRRNQN